MRTLFDWANQPDSINASLCTDKEIKWGDHVAWFTERLNDPDAVLLIAESGRTPVGQARAKRRGDRAEVAIYLDIGKRRGGTARRLLEALCAEAGARWPGVRMVVRIRHNNPISVNLYERAVFRFVGDEADHTVRER